MFISVHGSVFRTWKRLATIVTNFCFNPLPAHPAIEVSVPFAFRGGVDRRLRGAMRRMGWLACERCNVSTMPSCPWYGVAVVQSHNGRSIGAPFELCRPATKPSILHWVHADCACGAPAEQNTERKREAAKKNFFSRTHRTKMCTRPGRACVCVCCDCLLLGLAWAPRAHRLLSRQPAVVRQTKSVPDPGIRKRRTH